MNKFQVYRLLRRHVELAERRSVMYEANKVAQVVTMIGVGFIIIYLMLFSVLLSLMVNSSTIYTGSQFLFGFMPIVLIIDFVVRFIAQRTPAQMVKPYLLLPLRKYDCVDSFIMSSIMSRGNLLWMFFTVPYTIMSVVFNVGFFSALSFVLVFQVIIVLNSLFYMLCRTLVTGNMLWAALPFVGYALFFMPLLWGNFTGFLFTYASVGDWASGKSPLLYVALLLLVAFLFVLNRYVQYGRISSETMREKDMKIKTISSFAFFDRFNEQGEYLKLELKGMLRNKNMRQTFIYSIVFVTLLSLLNSFTDVYDDSFSSRFWAVYPFTLMSIHLVRIMCPEGNFIESLLVRKENIRSLLEAKYYFYSAMLLLPLMLMLPTVFSDKYTMLMLVAMMFFTAGPMFCLLMQLAVTNKVTMPLNTKLTRKNGMETNYIQIVVEMVALFMPIVLMSMLGVVLGETMTYVVMLVVGLLFIATHKIWINNVYRRMMKRKYRNLEGFMTSR